MLRESEVNFWGVFPCFILCIYIILQEAEIRMDEGDMFESEVITFVAPKKSGWLKKKGKGELRQTSTLQQGKTPRLVL